MPFISTLQLVAGTDDSASATTAVVTATFTAGNRAHLFITCSDAATITTPTSSPSQVWTLLDGLDDATHGQRCAHYVSDALVGGSTTITETYSGLCLFRAIAVKEIGGTSGYDSAAGAHKANQQTAPTTSADATTSTATPALTSQPALYSAFCMNTESSSTPAAGTGFTSDGAIFSVIGGGTALARGESLRVTSTTGIAATFTAGANVNHQTFAAVFLESGGGGGSTTLMPQCCL